MLAIGGELCEVTHVVCIAGDGIDGALTVTMEREGWACARTKWSSGVARQ